MMMGVFEFIRNSTKPKPRRISIPSSKQQNHEKKSIMEVATAEGIGVGGKSEDRVLVTAQQIINSLSNTPKDVRENMLMILSSFDDRLSSISSLINTEESKKLRFDEAEKMIIGQSHLWEDNADEYLAAVDDVLDYIDEPSIGGDSEVMCHAQRAIQLAMSRLLEEFRQILICNAVPLDAERLYSLDLDDELIYDNFSSFSDSESESACYHEWGASLGGDDCVDLISPDAVVGLKEIVDRMIRSGYEKECCQVYVNVRRDALVECLSILGVEKLGIKEVRKMEWKTLNEKMKKWTQAVKITVKGLLTGEKRLCDWIFSESDSMSEICFNETTKVGVKQLLNFGEGVAVAKRSPDKLFRILYMYDALADVLPYLKEMVTNDIVIGDAQRVLTALGEAAKGTLAEFESNVKNEASRKPILGGDIHPLARCVMNYVKLAVDCSDTLNPLLEDDIDELDALQSDNGDNLKLAGMSPIRRHVLLSLSYLESNLEEKSKFYKDGGLQYIFLMNNAQYIVREVKDSELGKLLGDDWVRRRCGLVRQRETSYLRASWTKVLSCLRHEGIGGSANNVSKVALKERFKNFNACFEEIYRVQTAWKVSDPQLREELRTSITEKVLLAYRSFEGRFANQLEGEKHAGRYIKYTADDLEKYVLDLFEGTGGVLPYTRRKSRSNTRVV